MYQKSTIPKIYLAKKIVCTISGGNFRHLRDQGLVLGKDEVTLLCCDNIFKWVLSKQHHPQQNTETPDLNIIMGDLSLWNIIFIKSDKCKCGFLNKVII